MTIMYVVNCDK